MLLNTKQSKGESIEHFFGKLKELSDNCELGSQEDTLIRDLLVANKQDPEIQKELLRETLEPAQALRLAKNMELGQRNQLQITNSQPASHVNVVTPQRSFRQPSQRPTTSSFTRPSNQQCRNCGLLGQQTTRTSVLQGARPVITVVYKIIFHEWAENRSPHQISLLARMLTLLKKPQLIRR